MKNTILALLFIFFFSTLNGQITFSKRYHVDFFSAGTARAVVATDSCYYVGGVYGDTILEHPTSSFLMKIDLEGEIQEVNTITDTARAMSNWSSSMFQVNSNEFVTTGKETGNGELSEGYFLQMSDKGEITKLTTFSSPYSPENSFISNRKVVSTLDGSYFILSQIQSPASLAEMLLTKLSEHGDIIWQKKYSNNYLYEPKSLVAVDDGGLLIGTSRRTSFIWCDYVSRCNVIKLDSEGGIEWEYQAPSHLLTNTASGMVLLEDGSVIVASGKGTELFVNGSSCQMGWDTYIFKLNPEHELEWGVDILSNNLAYPLNYFTNLIEAPDESGYVAIGITQRPHEDSLGLDSFGWVVKVSPEGDSLWGRRYHHIDNIQERHVFYDIETTPDGGYIVCGESIVRDPEDFDAPFQQPWLVKLDEYGCLVPGCHLDTSVEDAGGEDEEAFELKLYPNPTSDYLNIWLRMDRAAPLGRFSVVNASGQLIQSFDAQGWEDTYLLPVWDLPQGMYWLQYEVAGRVLQSEGFSVVHAR